MTPRVAPPADPPHLCGHLSPGTTLPWSFFLGAFSTILTPGPNMLYTAAAGAGRGMRGGAIAAVAVGLGGVCYTLATVLGISAMITAYPPLFRAIQIVGLTYLAWLGVRLLYRAREAGTAAEPARVDLGIFRGGLIISLTNPLLAVFFLSFLTGFVVPGHGSVPLQLLRLGLTFNACAFTAMLSVGLLAGRAGQVRVASPRFRQIMRGVTGLIFVALAVRTAVRMLS
ncbi:MAG TPA: LysE family translocator [Gemmatimonadales bacterium]|jgi:leucine efflux protein|nr:LysE family translocator [Gemmatimonadales bacterium]